MSVVAETVNVTGQSNLMQFRVPPCRLPDDMANLFEKHNFSDCLLVTGTKEFHVSSIFLTTFLCRFFSVEGAGGREGEAGLLWECDLMIDLTCKPFVVYDLKRLGFIWHNRYPSPASRTSPSSFRSMPCFSLVVPELQLQFKRLPIAQESQSLLHKSADFF